MTNATRADNGTLENKLQQLRASMDKRRADKSPAEKSPPEEAQPVAATPAPILNSQVVNLPGWSEHKRAMANELVRSALFRPESRKKRAYLEDTEIYCYGDKANITYTGQELRTDDEDLFCQILHLARSVPLGQPISFTALQILRALDWDTNARGYNRLHQALKRLTATSLNFASTDRGYSGSLIAEFEWRRRAGVRAKSEYRIKLWLHPRIRVFFHGYHYTLINWQIRKQLKPLAKKLHSFYASHRHPYPVKIETLYKISGSNTSDPYRFKQMLKEALTQLQESAFLESFEFADDKVVVKREFAKD